MHQRKTTGVTRINKTTQRKLFKFIDTNIPTKFQKGMDSKIVSDAVEAWLTLMERYTLSDFTETHQGRTPAEILVSIIEGEDG